MTSTLTAISTVLGADGATRARLAHARLAPGGQERGGEHDTRAARTPLASQAARWQLILDLLDPDKRCGAWSPATIQGRPVVCTRAPTTRARSTPTPKPGGAGRWRKMNETCDRCGPAIGAAYLVDRSGRAVPVRTVREPALAGAVRTGLDLLAAGHARARAASQRRSRLRLARRRGIAVAAGVVLRQMTARRGPRAAAPAGPHRNPPRHWLPRARRQPGG